MEGGGETKGSITLLNNPATARQRIERLLVAAALVNHLVNTNQLFFFNG